MTGCATTAGGIGLSGYREMLERIAGDPDLRFEIQLLVADPPHVASRLRFDCTPKGKFLGLDVNGRKVSFSENVFYAFPGGKDRGGMVDHRQGGHRSPASGRLAGPPLDEPEADQGGGEQVEPEQDVEPALVADGEPPEAREPGQRALDHPAVAARRSLLSIPRRAMRGTMPRLRQARRQWS